MLKILEGHPEGTEVPAISLKQPWAAAVALLGRDVESRSKWPFSYRGPIVIHASESAPSEDDFELLAEIAAEDGVDEEDLAALDPASESFAREVFAGGLIVAVANLAEVFGPDEEMPEDHPAAESPWAEDGAPFWLYFDEVVAVDPVPFDGEPEMFEVPWEVVRKLRALPAK